MPWSEATEEERLDPNNGILLSPLYDALFDRHLISFDDNGKILVSERIADETNVLQVDRHAEITVDDGMKPFPARHRNKLQ